MTPVYRPYTVAESLKVNEEWRPGITAIFNSLKAAGPRKDDWDILSDAKAEWARRNPPVVTK